MFRVKLYTHMCYIFICIYIEFIISLIFVTYTRTRNIQDVRCFTYTIDYLTLMQYTSRKKKKSNFHGSLCMVIAELKSRTYRLLPYLQTVPVLHSFKEVFPYKNALYNPYRFSGEILHHSYFIYIYIFLLFPNSIWFFVRAREQ